MINLMINLDKTEGILSYIVKLMKEEISKCLEMCSATNMTNNSIISILKF